MYGTNRSQQHNDHITSSSTHPHSPWDGTNQSVHSTADRSVFSHGGGSTLERDPFLSRSIMSGEYRVRDPHNRGPHQLSSVSMRLAAQEQHDYWNRSHRGDTSGLIYSQSLTTPRDPVTHHNHRKPGNSTTPNGSAKLIKDLQPTNGIHQSKHSLDLSKTSLNNSPTPPQTLQINNKDYGAFNSLVSLIFISLISLIVAALAAQLLFRLNARTASGIYGDSQSVLSNKSYDTTQEVTVALTTFVFMLDICCLLVCSMQFFFAAKLTKCSQGEERYGRRLTNVEKNQWV